MLRLGRVRRLPRGYHRPTDGAWRGSHPEPALLANTARAVPGTARQRRRCWRHDHHSWRIRTPTAPRRDRQVGPGARHHARPTPGPAADERMTTARRTANNRALDAAVLEFERAHPPALQVERVCL